MPKLPGVNHAQAIRALEMAGFKIIRQSGHVVLSNGIRFVVVPRNIPSTPLRWAVSPKTLVLL
jgi:predicted RNA binding protein YcfA (HicA-like mRNA interferase family)